MPDQQPQTKITDLPSELLSYLGKINKNPHLAAADKTFKTQTQDDMEKTKEFATCVKNNSGNERLCLDGARDVKYPLKCTALCDLMTWSYEKDCNYQCSNSQLKFEYPYLKSDETKLIMLLLAQGNHQIRLEMEPRGDFDLANDFFKYLNTITAYNPLACVEFPCNYHNIVYNPHSSTVNEYNFPTPNSIVEDLEFLEKNSIRFKSVIIYHYPGDYDYMNDEIQEKSIFFLNHDEIKDTINSELSEYMESLFPNTLKTYLAARNPHGDLPATCGEFAGPCILLVYGDVKGYSYAEDLIKKATDSQSIMLEAVSAARKKQQ